MNRNAIFLAVAIGLAAGAVCPPTAEAASSDTIISIFYSTRTVRVYPSPNKGGSGTVDYKIVLHADGTVEDAYEESSGGRKGAVKTKLGNQPRKAIYRVVDGSTIERTAEEETHIHKLTIKVNGKNCAANVEYVLKPGHTAYRGWSTQLKQWAYYSEMKMEYATCVIE